LPVIEALYDVEITNALADITLTQRYKNNTDKFVEVDYNFPVNPNACIYRFTADFGDKIVEGVVKEREAAKQEFEKAVS
jgi:Ca-activated chloride channel homolog